MIGNLANDFIQFLKFFIKILIFLMKNQIKTFAFIWIIEILKILSLKININYY